MHKPLFQFTTRNCTLIQRPNCSRSKLSFRENETSNRVISRNLRIIESKRAFHLSTRYCNIERHALRRHDRWSTAKTAQFFFSSSTKRRGRREREKQSRHSQRNGEGKRRGSHAKLCDERKKERKERGEKLSRRSIKFRWNFERSGTSGSSRH